MLDQSTHRVKLYNILQAIFTSPLGSKFAFKGGTLCYFLHALPRFSTDIDIDYLGTLEEMPGIWRELEVIFTQFSQIKDNAENTYLKSYSLSYGDNMMKIKVEIRKVFWENNIYEYVDFLGTNMRVMEKSCIAANKLVATYERGANRDYFDIYFFLKNTWPIHEKLILERTNENLQPFFGKLAQKIRDTPPANLLSGLGDVLTEKQKYWVKNSLIKELLGLLDFRTKFG